MNTIKVVHLVQDLKIGGLETTAVNIAAGLDRGEFSAELWGLSGGGPLEEALAAEKIAFRRFDFRRYLSPRTIGTLSRQLKEGGFSIVHTHGFAAGVPGRLAAKLAGIRAVFHHHHTTNTGSLGLRQEITDRVLTGAFTTRVIACSDAVRDFVVRDGFARPDKVTVVYNGVRGGFSGPSGSAEKVLDCLGLRDRKVIVSVASLTPHKGHRHLVSAAERVLREHPSAVFLLVGDGPERQALENQCEQLGLSRSFVFAGQQRDVRPYLECASVYVQPSLREGLGIGIIEAMAKALPVVATRIGGIPEAVADGETGLLCPPEDPGALAAALSSLLADEKKRKQFGQNGLARFRERFTFETAVRRIEALYREALSRTDTL